MKMSCYTCIHREELFCNLWGTSTTPTNFCTSYNRDPNEPLDAGNEVEIGVNLSLEEVNDLNGDDDETWAATVPYRGK